MVALWTPEFLIYGFGFALIWVILLAMVGFALPDSIYVSIAWIIAWIIIYIILSLMKNTGFVPCVEILSNNMGGCV